MSDTLRPLDYIDIRSRFAAGQSEINSRLELRAQLQIYHAVMIGVITTIFFTLIKDEHKFVLPLFTILIPLVSFYFVLLYIHNDKIIGILSAFNRSLEAISESVNSEAKLPRWFRGGAADGQDTWMSEALEARKLGNQATVLITMVSPVITLVELVISRLPIRRIENSQLKELALREWNTKLYISLGCIIIALFIIKKCTICYKTSKILEIM